MKRMFFNIGLYLEATQQLALEAIKIDEDWLFDLHEWLHLRVPYTVSTASCACKLLQKAFGYAKRKKYITNNPIIGIKLPRGPVKEVRSLSVEQVDRFFALQVEPRYVDMHKWYGLMLLTGLDYPDTKQYMRNRTKYEYETDKGRVIVIKRSKTDQPSVIPIDGHVMRDRLLHLLNNPPSREYSHSWLHVFVADKVAKALGVDYPLNIKIARKTAGQLFLTKLSMKAVSRVLGHSSVSTTEKYYVKTQLNTVLDEL